MVLPSAPLDVARQLGGRAFQSVYYMAGVALAAAVRIDDLRGSTGEHARPQQFRGRGSQRVERKPVVAVHEHDRIRPLEIGCFDAARTMPFEIDATLGAHAHVRGRRRAPDFPMEAAAAHFETVPELLAEVLRDECAAVDVAVTDDEYAPDGAPGEARARRRVRARHRSRRAPPPPQRRYDSADRH